MLLAATLLVSLFGPPSRGLNSGHVGSAHSQAQRVQVWEKLVEPGLTYRMEWDPSLPRVVHALRLNLRSQELRPIAELAGKTVYEDTPSKGRAKVSRMVADDNAVAGINGDFFPFTGHPLGITVRDGELLSSPYQPKTDADAHRASFGWGGGFVGLGFASLQLLVEPKSGPAIPVEGLNEDCGPDRVTLDGPSAGFGIAKAPNTYVILQTPEAAWTPNTTFAGTVTSVGKDLIKQPIASGTAVLVASGRAQPQLAGLKAGDSVTVRFKTTGYDFDRVKNVIGGGPVLVNKGQVVVDAAEERFTAKFSTERNPRTAIGRTKRGEMWLVAIDGRSNISVGATLQELAEEMLKLGCVEAINLDGGGSTTLNLLGLTMNRPSDGIEREDADGVLILGPKPVASSRSIELSALPHGITQRGKDRLAVLDSTSRRALPNSEVFWTCTGAAWIDQGGTLHMRSAGTAHVKAYVHGVVLSGDYPVAARD